MNKPGGIGREMHPSGAQVPIIHPGNLIGSICSVVTGKSQRRLAPIPDSTGNSDGALRCETMFVEDL